MESDDEKVEQTEPLTREQMARITSGHRGLKFLVLAQALLIFILFGVVVGTIAYRAALL